MPKILTKDSKRTFRVVVVFLGKWGGVRPGAGRKPIGRLIKPVIPVTEVTKGSGF